MTQIFISYAREDREFVDDLKSRLEQNGYDTWIDSESIRLGKDWRLEIDNGIQDSDVVIVVMTPEAKQSEYVTYEWAYALGARKDVITILLERTTLHSRLEALQYVDFCKVQRWKEFFRGLERISDKPADLERTEMEPTVANNIPTYIRQAIDALDELDPEKHENAVEKLAQSNHPAARDALIVALNHSSRDVRINSAMALAQVADEHDPKLVQGLVEAYVYGTMGWAGIRRGAESYLIDMNRDAIPELARLLNSNDQSLHKGATKILMQIAKPEDASILIRAFTTCDDNSLRLRLDGFLIRMGQPVVPPLVEALASTTTELRRGIISILGQIRDETATPGLIGMLLDPNRFVRADAIKALGRMKDERAVPGLIGMLSDTEVVERLDDYWPKEVRRITRVCDVAADALKHIGTSEALEAVEKWEQEQNRNTESS